MRKYLIFPSYIYDENDNPRLVGAAELMKKYKVEFKDCFVMKDSDYDIYFRNGTITGLNQVQVDNMIHLCPDYTGIYNLTDVKKQRRIIKNILSSN